MNSAVHVNLPLPASRECYSIQKRVGPLCDLRVLIHKDNPSLLRVMYDVQLPTMWSCNSLPFRLSATPDSTWPQEPPARPMDSRAKPQYTSEWPAEVSVRLWPASPLPASFRVAAVFEGLGKVSSVLMTKRVNYVSAGCS